MNSDNQNQEIVIELTVVPDSQRLDYLPSFHSNVLEMMRIEHTVYAFMQKLCDRYSGGYWEYFNMSNNGFFMQYDSDEFMLMCSPNGFEAEVTGKQASIVAMLFSLSYLSCWAYENNIQDSNRLYTKLYHLLMNYVHQLPYEESKSIFSLID